MHWMVLRGNNVGSLVDYFNTSTVFDELHLRPKRRIYGVVPHVAGKIEKIRRVGWEVTPKNSIYSSART